MKILCIGAGAIGICVGGSLAAVGAEIVYLERPEQKKELLGKTLTIINRSVVHHVSRFEIITEYRELEEVQIDCILIAVKAFDTDTVISQLKKSGLKFSSFLCLQNGIENEGKLHEAFPKADIIGASVVSAVSRLDLTSVRVEKNRGIGLCGSGEVFERIFGLLQKSGLRPMKFKDLAAMKWSKMISNLFANATSGILDMTPLEIYSRPGLFRIEKQQILEGLTVRSEDQDAAGCPVEAAVRALGSQGAR